MFEHAEFSIRVYVDQGDPQATLIYEQRKVMPTQWLKDDRHYGYAAFYFEEMYNEMLAATKDHR